MLEQPLYPKEMVVRRHRRLRQQRGWVQPHLLRWVSLWSPVLHVGPRIHAQPTETTSPTGPTAGRHIDRCRRRTLKASANGEYVALRGEEKSYMTPLYNFPWYRHTCHMFPPVCERNETRFAIVIHHALGGIYTWHTSVSAQWAWVLRESFFILRWAGGCEWTIWSSLYLLEGSGI